MKRSDDIEQEAIRAVARELIAAGWRPGNAYAYATRCVLGRSRGLTQDHKTALLDAGRSRRTPAAGGGMNAGKTLSGWGSDWTPKRRAAEQKAVAARVSAVAARRKLRGIGTERQREAHILVRVEGLRPAEAARRLGIGRQTVADLLAKFDKAQRASKNGHLPGD